MFNNINVSMDNNSQHFADTNSLVNGIASLVQGWLDPTVSPELREQHYRQILLAKQAFNTLGLGDRVVRLYQVELVTEEVVVIPGISADNGYVVLFIDNQLLVPVDCNWKWYEKQVSVNNFKHGCNLGRIQVRHCTMLGR